MAKDDYPWIAGKTAIVTGGTDGLGLSCARELAHQGARVVMACRDIAWGERAWQRITSYRPVAERIEVRALDLADEESIRRFALEIRADFGSVDILVNCARAGRACGGRTKRGHNIHLGVNHLGHFALTNLLLGALSEAPAARVVGVSCLAAFGAPVPTAASFESESLDEHEAYSCSKLANLLHIVELDRRLRALGAPIVAVAAHPGAVLSNENEDLVLGPGTPFTCDYYARVMPITNRVKAREVMPVFHAATAPGLRGGTMYAPGGYKQLFGPPVEHALPSEARDATAARGLWELSEQLTGTRFG